MADPKLLALLEKSVENWNWWREEHPGFRADFSGADFRGRKLRGASFQNADLRGCDFSGADLRFADFEGSLLSDARCDQANMAAATLKDTEAIRASFAGADLRGADLRKADLAESDLSGADLRAAKLRRASFAGAILGGARLAGADLTEARNLTDAQLASAETEAGRVGCLGWLSALALL